jgi:hypothetical protein
MRKTSSLAALLASGPIIGYDQGPGAKGLGGYSQAADILVQAADGTDLFEIFSEIQETLARWNGERNDLISQFSYRTTDTVENVGTPGSTDFEEASEFGQPRGGGGYSWFNRGYDFKFYDLAQRFTYRFLAEAGGEQIRMLANEALEADNRLLFNKVMKTLYNPLNLQGIADKNLPSTVYKFYNGDGEVPPPYEGNTFVGTHTHYSTTQTLASSATLTSATLDAVELDFYKHGNTPNLNGTELILMVNPQEGSIIRGFRVLNGAKYDFMPGSNYGGGIYLPQNGGIINRPQGELPYQIGTYGPWKIIERPGYLVPGYLVFLASGGSNNIKNPVGIREHINGTQRGLKLIPGARSDYPLVDSFYTRGFGTGIRQRGSGYLVQVTNNATYTTPTQYV